MFSKDIEIVIALLQNVNNSCVGSGGGDGDGGVDGCVVGGCVSAGGVGGEGGVLVVMVLVMVVVAIVVLVPSPPPTSLFLKFCSNFNISRKLTFFCFGHISVKFCSN